MRLLLLIGCILYVSASDISLGRSYDALVDLARLYRMQRLADFDEYLDSDLEGRSSNDDWAAADGGYRDALFSDPLYSGTHTRDQEHLEHSSLWGAQKVSVPGGSFHGNPKEKQQKTDKTLPAYCNPPNPCPIGKTSADNCVENFENSADNNKRLLEQQDCPCDTEHMLSCPPGGKTVSSQPQGDAALNKVMDELQKLGVSGDELTNPYLSAGHKREGLVAKKSPNLIKKRSIRERAPTAAHRNPYLQGIKLKRAAKKSPPM